MGNFIQQITPSADDVAAVGSGVIAQAGASQSEIYSLVQPPTYNTKDRGRLVQAAAKCFNTKDIAGLHEIIREELKDYVYNNGEGEYIRLKELIEQRNRARSENALKKEQENSGFYSGLNLWHRIFNRSSSGSNFTFTDSESKRKCCWKIDRRGALGETPLHVCLLNNSEVHDLLAKEIINVYPNLLHDIYLGDEYYGENVLHMAIANENMNLVKLILKKGKEVDFNLQERCCGKFFCPADQISARSDSQISEIVQVPRETNYKGLVYWGEYALSFAACSNQKKAFETLQENGADLLAQDSNGNNILHLMVVHNNKEMFNLSYNRAGDKQSELLEAPNKQNLTPLTLSAKLANKEMLNHILELKREVAWVFGDVTCAHYPLSDIDTINPKDGSINTNSALSIILNAETTEHLSMLDGMLYQLLHEKWKQYAKIKFYQRGAFFILFLAIFIAAVFLQPPQPRIVLTVNSENITSTVDDCYLLAASDGQQIARFVCEIITVLGAIAYLLLACLEVYNEGFPIFWHTIVNAPMKGSFLISCVLFITIIPCRFACSVVAENVILTLSIFTCIPYLFFFCRGFKLVGPFIVAIYNMIKGDLLRFLLIYVIFLMGFSQAMYVLFRGVDHPLFSYPFLSVLGMFIITLGEFGDLYGDFDQIRNPNAAKILFVVYMVLVTVLLINVLIAMMGNTFNKIAETRWEWQRQWAKIVLVMEQSVPPDNRKRKQRRYSQPDKDDDEKRWFVIRNFKENKTSPSVI